MKKFINTLGLSDNFFDQNIRAEAVRDFSSTVITHDLEERKATEEERRALTGIIGGALSSIAFYACTDEWKPENVRIVKDTAEFTAIYLLPNINNYNTVYNRIQKIIDLFTEN
jgi:hypothetical protein